MPLKAIRNTYGIYDIGVSVEDADLLTAVTRVNHHRQTEGVYISYPVIAHRVNPNKSGYDRELHLFVVERALNRKLKINENVHHINGDSCNAYRSNLLVCRRGEHSRLHRLMSNAYVQECYLNLRSDGVTRILQGGGVCGKIYISTIDVDLLTKRLRLRKNGSHVAGDFRLEVAVQKQMGGQGNKNYKALSSVICARMIGRELTREEIPHHKNANSLDDRRENLQICTRVEHGRLHAEACHSYMQKHFRSPLTDEKLQLLEGLLSRKTQTISGVYIVI